MTICLVVLRGNRRCTKVTITAKTKGNVDVEGEWGLGECRCLGLQGGQSWLGW